MCIRDRYEAADAADDEVDLHAVFGGLVESVDHCGVLEGVPFEDDTSAFALVGKGYFTVDEAVQFRYEVEADVYKRQDFKILLTII